MDEREELKWELQWVQYRQKSMDIMEEKLISDLNDFLKQKLEEKTKRETTSITKVDPEAPYDSVNEFLGRL